MMLNTCSKISAKLLQKGLSSLPKPSNAMPDFEDLEDGEEDPISNYFVFQE